MVRAFVAVTVAFLICLALLYISIFIITVVR